MSLFTRRLFTPPATITRRRTNKIRPELSSLELMIAPAAFTVDESGNDTTGDV